MELFMGHRKVPLAKIFQRWQEQRKKIIIILSDNWRRGKAAILFYKAKSMRIR
jgi:hypothetical protein